MAVDASSLGSSAAAGGALTVALLLLFGLLRKAAGFHKFFAPNRCAPACSRPAGCPASDRHHALLLRRHNPPGRQPKPLPLGVWRWMAVVWRYPQPEVIQLAGMDAAMHLRVLGFGARPSPREVAGFGFLCLG